MSAILLCAICTFPIIHLAPQPPPPRPPPPSKKKTKQNKSIIIVFNFSWGNCNTQKELTTMVMQNFGVTEGVLWELSMSICYIIFVGHHKCYGCNHVVANFSSPFTLYLWSCNPTSALLQARVTLRRTLRDMARELSLSTGSLPSSTSDSLSTKSDQSHSLSSLSINGGKFSLVFCILEYFPQTG